MSETKPTPGPWRFDSYNTIYAGRVQICSIPDHPQDEEFGPEPDQRKARDDWYAESQANAFQITGIHDMISTIQRLEAEKAELVAALKDLIGLTEHVSRLAATVPDLSMHRAALARARGEV